MAKLLGLFLVLTFIVVVTANVTSTAIGTKANCDFDLFALIPPCVLYVLPPANPKEPPSKECCDVFQKVDVPCLCSKVDKGIEEIISMEKVVYVANYCKRPFTPGSKCGSYTIPPLDQ